MEFSKSLLSHTTNIISHTVYIRWIKVLLYGNSKFKDSVLLGKQPHFILRVMVPVLKNCKALSAGPYACPLKVNITSPMLYINKNVYFSKCIYTNKL